MVSWAWPRKSYEARVLVVPLDDPSRAAIETLGPNGLDGVSVLYPVAARAGQPSASAVDDPEPSSEAEHAVHEADMVVLLVHNLADIDDGAVIDVCDAARAEGRLIAAVIVDAELSWHGASAQRSAVVVREAVDSVVVLRDIKLATAFIDVLRGGDRDTPALAAAR